MMNSEMAALRIPTRFEKPILRKKMRYFDSVTAKTKVKMKDLKLIEM